MTAGVAEEVMEIEMVVEMEEGEAVRIMKDRSPFPAIRNQLHWQSH